MNKPQELAVIKRAIRRGETEYKGITLPTVQKTGTGLQIESHAMQLANTFYADHFESTNSKILIPNDKFIATVCELADRVVVAQFGGADKEDVGDGGTKYTETAQDFFNEVYDEFEYTLNNSLNIWADNE